MVQRVDERARRTRRAITLGAALTLVGAVLTGFDASASWAAGGLIDAVFRPTRVRNFIMAATRPANGHRAAGSWSSAASRCAARHVERPAPAIQNISPRVDPAFRLMAPPKVRLAGRHAFKRRAAEGSDPTAATTAAFYTDPTLVPGDAIVSTQGVRILRPGRRYPFSAADFMSLQEARATPLAIRQALLAINRASKTPQGPKAIPAAGL